MMPSDIEGESRSPFTDGLPELVVELPRPLKLRVRSISRSVTFTLIFAPDANVRVIVPFESGAPREPGASLIFNATKICAWTCAARATQTKPRLVMNRVKRTTGLLV